MTVRQARREDAPALHANCKPATTLQQVELQLEWTCRERAPHHLEHLVALDKDAVVGNIMLLPRGGHAVEGEDGRLTLCRGRNGATLTIATLADWVVTGGLQGRGLGTRLAQAAIDEARAWGVERLEASSSNPSAISTLKRLGFKVWGQFPTDDDHFETFLIAVL